MMHMQELEGDPRSLDFNGRSLSKRNFQLFSITELEFAADQTVPIEPLPCRGMHLHHAPGNLRGTVEPSSNFDMYGRHRYIMCRHHDSLGFWARERGFHLLIER